MLNEIKEYTEYRDINTCETSRINYSTFIKQKKCQGIPRIFTILARYYLFTENNYVSPENIKGENIAEKRSNLRKETISMLREWLLGSFLEFCISSEKEKRSNKKENPTQILEYRDKKEWTKDSIYNFKNSKKNTVNAINYDIIIADAINQGPLRNLCLVLKETAFDYITYYTISKKHGIVISETKQLNKLPLEKEDKDIFDRLLKYISAAILSLDGYEVTNADLSYWTKYKPLADSSGKTIFLYRNELLIETDPTKKSRLNPDFVSSYGVQLMPVDEAKIRMKEDEYKGYLFFEDTGAGYMQPLN